MLSPFAEHCVCGLGFYLGFLGGPFCPVIVSLGSNGVLEHIVVFCWCPLKGEKLMGMVM